jgi:hypothetical protein
MLNITVEMYGPLSIWTNLTSLSPIYPSNFLCVFGGSSITSATIMSTVQAQSDKSTTAMQWGYQPTPQFDVQSIIFRPTLPASPKELGITRVLLLCKTPVWSTPAQLTNPFALSSTTVEVTFNGFDVSQSRRIYNFTAPFRVDSVYPTVALSTGGTTLTILGANFRPLDAWTTGGVCASGACQALRWRLRLGPGLQYTTVEVKFVTSTMLTAVLPAMPADVTIGQQVLIAVTDNGQDYIWGPAPTAVFKYVVHLCS